MNNNTVRNLLVTLIFVSGHGNAVQPLEMVDAIVDEYADPQQLIITGQNFNNGGSIQLTLGERPLNYEALPIRRLLLQPIK